MCSLPTEYTQLRRDSDAKSTFPTASAHTLWSSKMLASAALGRPHAHLQFHPAGRDVLPTLGMPAATPRIRRQVHVSHLLPAGRDVIPTKGIPTTTPRIRRQEHVTHPLPAGRYVLPSQGISTTTPRIRPQVHSRTPTFTCTFAPKHTSHVESHTFNHIHSRTHTFTYIFKFVARWATCKTHDLGLFKHAYLTHCWQTSMFICTNYPPPHKRALGVKLAA